MKNVIKLVVVTLLFGLSNNIHAQKNNIVTKEIQVEGVCNMCKKRIENAALIKGVKVAKWDKEAGILKVIYNQLKVSDTTICKSIAGEGHDTHLVKASDESYQKLPDCCAYRGSINKH